MAPSNVLSSFSVGRPTSLVIDIGSSGFKISPIIDGYELKKARICSSRGGTYIDEILDNYVTNKVNITVHPWYEKTKRDFKLSESFRALHQRDIVRDVKHW